jgi:hypothetical protein
MLYITINNFEGGGILRGEISGKDRYCIIKLDLEILFLGCELYRSGS